MNRLFTSLLASAFALSVGAGAALADPGHGHAMATGSMMHPMTGNMTGHTMGHRVSHHSHRYGNDKARCRDSKGRFLKKSDPRCLAK